MSLIEIQVTTISPAWSATKAPAPSVYIDAHRYVKAGNLSGAGSSLDIEMYLESMSGL